MNENEYLSLCEKYLKGTCTPEEEILLKEFQETHLLSDQPWVSETMGDERMVTKEIFDRLQRSIQHSREAKIVRLRPRLRTAAAAVAAFMFIGVSAYLLSHRSAPGNSRVNIRQQAGVLKKRIVPGSNKAILTLADGSEIDLNSTKNGIVTVQGKTNITKSGDGILVYNSPDKKMHAGILPHDNTLTIPRGGRYKIVLPDGSSVWLNSSSTLTFPTTFTGDQRLVHLTGEAYFEVAKNKKMPFKVLLKDNTQVEVLGTHFNVKAYEDERNIKTTLLEGSVKLSSGSGKRMLVPGQQGVVDLKADKSISVREADVDEAVSWKNGNFMFVNEDITSIMRKISRWYNVDIVYRDDVSDKTFTGTISQFSDVTDVLRIIQLTKVVHFKIEERRIIVMQ